MMRVLHVIPSVAPRYGGPSRAVRGMSVALREAGLDVLIATTDADGSGRLPVLLGTPTVFQDVPSIFFRRQWSESWKYSRPFARWLNAHVSEFNVVHIHAVFSHCCLAAASACWKRYVPYVVRPLGTLDPWSMRQKPLRKRLMWQLGIKQMLDRARAIHYTTSEEQRLAEGSLGLSRGITIPLGVDEEIMQRCDRRDANVTPYVLVLSRLHPKKGLEDFIDVFLSATAPGDLRNWRLLLAGNGEPKYVAALERLVQAREATDRVIFTGWLDGEKRRTVLSEASLVALPSRQENFGLAVAEALACGVPVLVSTKVNLAEEIRAAGAGWVTSLDRFSQVATLIQALRAPAERSLRGAAGQKLVAEHFTWRAVGRQLVELYEGMTPRIDYPPATQVAHL